MKKFYITGAIPYVNAAPHIGHALEFIQVDVTARYHRLLLGKENVLALCGADENALKNVQAAEQAGISIRELVDKNNGLFLALVKTLDIQFDVWQRGSDEKHHFLSSQKLWELCAKNGDIYKKSYKGFYCVGCETFYSPDELDAKGECFEHPGKKLDVVEEENYFFKLSRYRDQITTLITSGELKIVPEIRKNEVRAFLNSGLHDLSISRSNERAKNWGVPVPVDPTQRIYVWFDALNIYQSGIGFGWDETTYKKWWPADVHIIGKGIIRFHAVYWIAFLLSAGLALPKTIFAHGYITIEGKKMSKTLGNVVDPMELIKKYGVDAVRYYLLREIPSYGDGDFSERRFKELYNADLANGLGNLVARVAKLCETQNVFIGKKGNMHFTHELDALQSFQFDLTLKSIWEDIQGRNRQIDIHKPWENPEKKHHILVDLVESLRQIAFNLKPFLPDTAEVIEKQFEGPVVKSQPPLFPRIK